MNNSTQQAIEQYYAAWRAGEAEQFPFTEDFSFDGPILSVTNPDEFRGMARQFGPMVKEVKILEASYQSDKAFVMVEFTTNLPQVGSWIAIDYFVVEGVKIKYSRTVYDPRKLAEFMQSRQSIALQ